MSSILWSPWGGAGEGAICASLRSGFGDDDGSKRGVGIYGHDGTFFVQFSGNCRAAEDRRAELFGDDPEFASLAEAKAAAERIVREVGWMEPSAALGGTPLAEMTEQEREIIGVLVASTLVAAASPSRLVEAANDIVGDLPTLNDVQRICAAQAHDQLGRLTLLPARYLGESGEAHRRWLCDALDAGGWVHDGATSLWVNTAQGMAR